MSSSNSRPIRTALLGFGTVGEGVFRMLTDNAEEVRRKTGATFEIVRVGVKDETKPRTVDASLFTTDLMSIIRDPDVDVVCELIGGETPAGELVEACLRSGKHVVTANKELIAKHGSRLISLAKSRSLDLHFEAAVGGGIPIVQALKHQLAGNDVLRLMGILNGTTNYILTQMKERGATFETALAEAQAAGYAEADPTNDVDGFDTMYKIAILTAITFGRQVDLAQVHREGIRSIKPQDFRCADLLGYCIKLLGICDEVEEGVVRVRVHPTLVPKAHQLANVEGVYNALWLHGDFVGDLMFSGRGAGASPTASAVVGDLIDVGRTILSQGQGSAIPYGDGLPAASMAGLWSRYYLRLRVVDRPNTLGKIASQFGQHDVGLAAMEMRVLGGGEGEIAFLTHACFEEKFLSALDVVKDSKEVVEVESWMRVVD